MGGLLRVRRDGIERRSAAAPPPHGRRRPRRSSHRRTGGDDAKGAAAELAVVFVGVLIALGVNSWWAAHQDHARLHADLQTLAQDMDQAALVLGTAISYDSANVARFTDVHDGLLAHHSAR